MIDWKLHANETGVSRSRCSRTIPRRCQVFRVIALNLPQIANVEDASRVPQRKKAERMRLSMHIIAAVAAASLFCTSPGLIAPANAQTIGSTYTSTAPKDCRVTSAGNGIDDSTIRVCPGMAGLKILVSEDDLRETVSVGRNSAAASREPAAQAWFGPFNSTTTTVEWRALDGKPFAIIQRW